MKHHHMTRTIEDERVISLEHIDGKLIRTAEVLPRTPVPVNIAMSHIAVSGNLILSGGNSREDHAAFNDRVKKLVDDAEHGKKPPHVTVFFDGRRYWLGDRYDVYMCQARRMDNLKAMIFSGDKYDSELYAVSNGHAISKEVKS